MRLPSFSGDPQTAKMFQLIDEQLSELYSIHGKQTARGGIKVTEPLIGTNEKPDLDFLYPDALIKGWYYDGIPDRGYNLKQTVISAGRYKYDFLAPVSISGENERMQAVFVSGWGSIGTTPGPFKLYTWESNLNDPNSFYVNVAEIDMVAHTITPATGTHSVLVLSRRKPA